jgi:light-regulated signal transduction histidine kinase (bacteriophytochrome)
MTHPVFETSASSLWTDQPYSIKRHGLTLTNCDSEPVQTPGCVQAHGALLVLRLADLTVLQASENSQALLGCPPEVLTARPGSGRSSQPNQPTATRSTSSRCHTASLCRHLT